MGLLYNSPFLLISFQFGRKQKKKKGEPHENLFLPFPFPFPSSISYQANKAVFFTSLSSLSFLSFHPKIVSTKIIMSYTTENYILLNNWSNMFWLYSFFPPKVEKLYCSYGRSYYLFTILLKDINLFKITELIVNFYLESHIFHNFIVRSCLCIKIKGQIQL